MLFDVGVDDRDLCDIADETDAVTTVV